MTDLMTPDGINRVVNEIAIALPRPITKRQEQIARSTLRTANAQTVRRALDRQAENRYWEFAEFLEELRLEHRRNNPDQPIECQLCDGEGWLPRPQDQFDENTTGGPATIRRCDHKL